MSKGEKSYMIIVYFFHQMTCLVTGKVSRKMTLKELLDICKKYQPFALVVCLAIFIINAINDSDDKS
jgi:hypothetical protein